MKYQQIISLITPELLNKSIETMSMNEICDIIGITKKTFYNHFSSKEELLLEVDQKILKEVFITEYEKKLEISKNSGVEKFHTIIDTFCDLFFTKTNYFSFFYINFDGINKAIIKEEFVKYKNFRQNYSAYFTNNFKSGLEDKTIKSIRGLGIDNILRSLNGICIYLITSINLGTITIEEAKTDLYDFKNFILENIRGEYE